MKFHSQPTGKPRSAGSKSGIRNRDLVPDCVRAFMPILQQRFIICLSGSALTS